MQKGILGYKNCEVHKIDRYIAQIIVEVLEFYEICNKIFSVILDNVTNNIVDVEILKPIFFPIYDSDFLLGVMHKYII